MNVNDALIAALLARCHIPSMPLMDMRRAAKDDMVAFLEQVIREGYLDRGHAGELAAEQFHRTYVKLTETLFQQEPLDLLTEAVARRFTAIPLYRMGEAVTVAMADPNDAKAIAALEALLKGKVSPVFSFKDEIESAIKIHYHSAQNVTALATSFDLSIFQKGALTDLQLAKLLETPRMVELNDSIVLLAVKERASDIHIETKKGEVLVRFRIDGALRDRLVLPMELGMLLISRVKVISQMDITERRKPQDGRLSFALPTHTLDLRISSLPTLFGEKVVMRILGSPTASSLLSLDTLDFAPEVLRNLKATLQSPQGILFVTGPTGSGKSTTLYGALNYINKRELNIVTIEDPVEYTVPTLNQVPVDTKVGRSFNDVLRATLRQDPDVILIGEIRDGETARIATQAALTGHLVLTTLHTNDAVQSITRLVEMGVERYAVGPSIIGILSQRLVRRVCSFCRTEHHPDPEELRQHFYWSEGQPLPTFYVGAGCAHCHGTGYYGRVGIHEFLKVTPQIREAVMQARSYDEILSLATAQGFRPLRYDGFKKVLRGVTTLKEVIRAIA